MKKRFIAMLICLIMVTGLVIGAIPAMAADDITIRFHYHREDGDYDDWNLWLWDLDGITTLEPPYELTVNGNEAICEFKVNAGTTRIGYIVRYGQWEAKDVDWDQFINITGVVSGAVDFYVESEVPTQASVNEIPSMEELIEMGNLVLNDDVVVGIMITANQYKESNRDGQPEITLQLSSKLDESYVVDENTFTVGNSDGTVPVTDIRYASNYVYLVLREALDLSRGYNITFEGRNYAVSMPDYYSHEKFEAMYTYTGDDLGATYSTTGTDLRVWAPTAIDVKVNLYSSGDPVADPTPYTQVPMTADVNGTWVALLPGDHHGTYYTYEVTTDTGVNEAADPYARTTGVNGKRSMIIDLDFTDPIGWANDSNPHAGENFTDAVIYELHIRDLSSDSSSGIRNVGKFLGLIESGTKTAGGNATGLDHIVDLGVTHIHLLPVYDFGSVDESKLYDPKVNHFNWGYDPVNYNVPEGSYSTDPYNGDARVAEMKQMVKGMHDAGLSVIMDVVYNHVYDANGFCFNKIVPGYFSRPKSNGSGCGNDTASERSMVRKYIIDSVTYWADEYHIDGFRFDLAGLIDIDTINGIMESVHKNHPDVVFYGEGWTLSTNTTKSGVTLCTQTNSQTVPGFAFFNDNIRNLIKGATYGGVSAGFISGGAASNGELLACFKGMPDWCRTPSQSINYLSCHDNNTLFDHISIAAPYASFDEKVAMNKLGAAFYLTAQGIPFFQAGEEILRSKPDVNSVTGFNENSYNAGDEVNSIKWSDLDNPTYQDVYQYYKGLIAFRKAHPALRMTDASSVEANVFDVYTGYDNVAAYQILGGMEGESTSSILVIFNASSYTEQIALPDGSWTVYVNGKTAGTQPLEVCSGSVSVDGISAMVLVEGSHMDIDPPPLPDPDIQPPTIDTDPDEDSSDGKGIRKANRSKIAEESSSPVVLIIIICVAAVLVVAAVILIIILVLKKKKR